MVIFQIIVLIFLAGIVFWQGSLLYASMFTVPTVYANDQAILDAFDLTGLKRGELLIDLGCGNAKTLIMGAEKYGARGIGVENSLYCYLKSRLNVLLAGQNHKIKIIFGDFKKIERDLVKADVVYLYLLNKTLANIEDWFFSKISNNTRVVVLCFEFPKHKPKTIRETRNLGRQTNLRMYVR